ncbi:MAG TPA: hypothetical protein VFS42_05445, partial [Burkholderiaceae bacterium]|nr:hypothetical protein [Burkholderiaceae bacterium]
MLPRVLANLSTLRHAQAQVEQPSHSRSESVGASSSHPLARDPLWEDPAEVAQQTTRDTGGLNWLRNALCFKAATPHWPGEAFRNAPNAPAVGELERSLTGVMILPHQTEQPLQEIVREQGPYGRHLRLGIEQGGEKIRRGDITCFRELWNHAVQVRVSAPSTKIVDLVNGKNPLEVRCDPTEPYSLESSAGELCDFVRVQAIAHPLYQRDFSGDERTGGDIVNVNNQDLRLISGSLNITGHLPTSDGRFETVGMTKFVHSELISLDKSETTKHVLARSFVHAQFRDLPKIGRHVGRLYREAMNAPDDAVFKEKAARLYWWTAHSCFDKRGSAAKLEIAYRSMYHARGLHCPLW